MCTQPPEILKGAVCTKDWISAGKEAGEADREIPLFLFPLYKIRNAPATASVFGRKYVHRTIVPAGLFSSDH